MNANELRAERAKLASEMRKVLDKADAEKRSLSGEEQQQWEKLNADVDALKGQIDREERIGALEKELAEPRNALKIGREDRKPENAIVSDSAARDARRHYMLTGQMLPEARAISGFGNSSISGLEVNDGFNVEIYDALKSYVGMRQAPVTVKSTDSGLDYPILVSDDTANTGELLTELASAGGGSDVEASVTQLVLKAYTFTSQPIVVSLQSLNDIGALEADVVQNAAIRIARKQNNLFTLGTGSSQPMGLVTATTTSVTAATGNTLTIPSDDIYNLEHAVDVAYRGLRLPNGGLACGFMMHDTTLKTVKKIKDTTNRYLWQASLAGGSPDTLDGYPIYINNDMAVPAVSAKSMIFAHFPSFVIRDVKSTILLRLSERYADQLAVGFIAFLRSDSNLKSAKASAKFVHSAS